MVEMLPFPVTKFKNETEEKLYNLFRENFIDDDYTVIYGRRWKRVSNRGNQDPECDFIIARPDEGILIVEVKGGIWERKNGNWYVNQEIVPSDDDPIEQSVNLKYALIELLKRSGHWSNIFFPIDYTIALPDTKYSDGDIDQLGVEVLTYSDLPHIKEWVSNAMQVCLQRSHPTKCSQGMINHLISVLMKDYVVRLNDILEIDEQKLIVLTNQELELDRKLARLKKITVQGCAGSGKTLMAIKQAKRLASRHDVNRILFTCQNQELGDWLAEQTKYIKDKCDTIPFINFCENHLLDQGAIDDYSKRNKTYLESLPYLVLKNIDSFPKYDAIIVDEGQMFDEDSWDLLNMLLVNNGNSYQYIFYDDLQRILSESSNPVPGEEQAIELTINIRNTANIHKQATKFLPDDKLPECNNIQGDPVWISFYNTNNNMKKLLRRYLMKLIQDGGISSKDIIVLTPYGGKRSCLREEQLGNFKLRSLESDDPSAIRYTNIYDFRGMERKVVIITELDNRNNSIEPFIYLGASRAKTKLIMLVSSDLEDEIKDKLLEGCEQYLGK